MKKRRDISVDQPADRPWWNTVLDILLFKASWILLVLYQELVIIPVLVLNAGKLFLATFRVQDLWLVLFMFLAGVLLDTVLLLAGVLVFQQSFLPIWLIILWLCFAITLPHGFGFIKTLSRTGQACCGALAGCVGYGAGMWLGAVTFGPVLPLALVVLGCCWALLIPGVVYASEYVQTRELS
jgi:hypothetical protein